MKLVKVGGAVLNQTPLDWLGNQANIEQALSLARAAQVSVLCLPEMCITGYGCEDAFLMPGVARRAWEMLGELVPQTRGMLVSFGLPIMHRNALFNAVCLACDGRVLGFVAKQNLASDGLHYEPRWFKAWPADTPAELRYGGGSFPLGDLFFDCGGVRLGFEICEDAWVAHRPGSDLARLGVDLILNPSASHFAFGKEAVRVGFVREGSRAFGCTYIYSNLVGNEAGRAIYDGGVIIASAGEVLAQGPRFTFEPVQLTAAVVDIDRTRMIQARTGSYDPSIGAGRGLCVRTTFPFPDREPERAATAQPAWTTGAYQKEECFTRAIALALFDYLRKSRSRGFVVSLSGGADSAAVACLVALMVSLASEELGDAGLREALAYVGDLDQAPDVAALIKRLLTCVYQATENSSNVTRDAASGLAAALNATFYELEVDVLVDGYVDMIAEAIGRELDWARDDVTLQNIQARARGPGVWMLANLRGALLLATSNRSEAAVGYATMDGDTCGGVSPIAGIDKAFLRRWLRWLETVGPEGLGCVPELDAVNRQAPTAELRPPEAHQTDEDDLMPYPILDAIERAAIRDKMEPLSVFRLIRSRFPDLEEGQLALWVERFFKLWSRNQWKRERYAPSFHVDDENLDPKTWCRFPILSGGFVAELATLRDFLAEETRADPDALEDVEPDDAEPDDAGPDDV